MEKFLDIKQLERNILTLKEINFHSFTIHHLANFNYFFHNLGSLGFEVEKQFGDRVDIRTVGPQSFIMINSIIYEYMHQESKFHSDAISLKLPIDYYLKDNLLPATYNKKCTYETIAKAYNLPIETVRRHSKIWLNTNIVLKDKERGMYTNLDIVFNSNLFKQTHFQIAQSMIDSWKIFIFSMNDLDVIKNKIYFEPGSITETKKISRHNYIKIIFNLNFFWYRALIYFKSSLLNFTELSVLSSALYFKNKERTLYSYENNNYYKNEILIPTNINSISNATLIPRETTRRTVHKLIKKGILIKKSNLIFISNDFLSGNYKINKYLKEIIIKDAMVILNTFNESLT